MHSGFHSLTGSIPDLNFLIEKYSRHTTNSFDGTLTTTEMRRIIQTISTLLDIQIDVKNQPIDESIRNIQQQYPNRGAIDAQLHRIGVLDDAGGIRIRTLESHVQEILLPDRAPKTSYLTDAIVHG